MEHGRAGPILGGARACAVCRSGWVVMCFGGVGGACAVRVRAQMDMEKNTAEIDRLLGGFVRPGYDVYVLGVQEVGARSRFAMCGSAR